MHQVRLAVVSNHQAQHSNQDMAFLRMFHPRSLCLSAHDYEQDFDEQQHRGGNTSAESSLCARREPCTLIIRAWTISLT
jgi:hypothetical protein